MNRADAVGMFWEDLPVAGRRGASVRAQPPIPDTGWLPPREFPRLRGVAPAIAFDTETRDDELLTRGPGWARGKAHIVGISVAVDPVHRWYFPIRHEVEPEYNMDPANVLAWANDTLSGPEPKLGANLMYDVGNLNAEGVTVGGHLWDVQFAEALLDETARVGLERLGQTYLGAGKETSVLYQWLADFYGGKPTEEQRKNIYRAPPRLVGPYAEQDAAMPLAILPFQWQRMAAENLLHLFDMECGLIPLLIAMRFAGVSVDRQRAEAMRDELELRERAGQSALDALVGDRVEVGKSVSLARAFDKLGLVYNRTAPTKAFPEGKPSFTKTFLKNAHNPVADAVNSIRGLSKLRGTFLENYILGANVNGKVHGQFHPLRSEGKGTRSGRFSSTDPNLQNIPIRSDDGRRVREIFVPDAGHKCWRKYDYSQIEYRFLAHFAVGPGSDELRRKYNDEPESDYHDYTIAIIHEIANLLLDRRPAKNMNFGLLFGMGKAKLVRELDLGRSKGREVYEAYHRAMPYARATMDYFAAQAMNTGIVRTILGRCNRFDLWEPMERDHDAERIALPFELAVRKWGYVKRAYAHKGLNRELQGSAADLLKTAMLKCWRDGVFSYTGVPRLTVHDELGFSDPGDRDDGFAEVERIMTTALPLRVPIIVDAGTGPNWGACS